MTGLCVACGPGEPGEFVGKIVRNHPVRDFEGYADSGIATSSVCKRGPVLLFFLMRKLKKTSTFSLSFSLSPLSLYQKIVRDVYSRGDLYFRSGDILVMDSLGWLYFKDRTGDTFRWRGENVSTTEVEASVASVVGMERDVVVYGVEVPGTEGRAGMAAIGDPEGTVDLEELAAGVRERLPSFARPVFVRLVAASEVIETTGTHKVKKFNLQVIKANLE